MNISQLKQVQKILKAPDLYGEILMNCPLGLSLGAGISYWSQTQCVNGGLLMSLLAGVIFMFPMGLLGIWLLGKGLPQGELKLKTLVVSSSWFCVMMVSLSLILFARISLGLESCFSI